MLNKIQNFFIELREKDETTKKRWLVILTSGTMVVVISFWALYLNFTVKNLNENQQEASSGFFQTFSNGLSIVSEKTAGKLSNVSAQIQSFVNKTNSVTIEGKTIDVVSKNLENIKPKKLP